MATPPQTQFWFTTLSIGSNGHTFRTVCASLHCSVTVSVSVPYGRSWLPVSFSRGRSENGVWKLTRRPTDFAAPLGDPSEPEVEVNTTFSHSAFGVMFFHIRISADDERIAVVNGQRNQMFLSVENKSDRNITLENIAGSLHHPETDKLIKNVRTATCRSRS